MNALLLRDYYVVLQSRVIHFIAQYMFTGHVFQRS